MRVVWLSRHRMTAKQRASLARDLRAYAQVGADEEVVLEIVNRSETLPVISNEAACRLCEIAESEGLRGEDGRLRGVMAGVLPANVAATYACWAQAGRFDGEPLVPFFVPVVMKARPRGLVHSHWEAL